MVSYTHSSPKKATFKKEVTLINPSILILLQNTLVLLNSFYPLFQDPAVGQTAQSYPRYNNGSTTSDAKQQHSDNRGQTQSTTHCTYFYRKHTQHSCYAKALSK